MNDSSNIFTVDKKVKFNFFSFLVLTIRMHLVIVKQSSIWSLQMYIALTKKLIEKAENVSVLCEKQMSWLN